MNWLSRRARAELAQRLINESGGIWYHGRAWRYRTTLWRPFISRLESLLLPALAGRAGRLVLVGPSAGWTLTDRVLTLFSELVLIEPDPLAVWLLRRRLARVAPAAVVNHDPHDYFADGDGPQHLRDAYAGDTVLFCNLLGQLHLLLAEPRLSAVRRGVRGILRAPGLTWLSYHDRCSADAPLLLPPSPAARLNDAACRACFPGAAPAACVDHGTGELFPGGQAAYADWEIVPGTHHLIECMHS